MTPRSFPDPTVQNCTDCNKMLEQLQKVNTFVHLWPILEDKLRIAFAAEFPTTPPAKSEDKAAISSLRRTAD